MKVKVAGKHQTMSIVMKNLSEEACVKLLKELLNNECK